MVAAPSTSVSSRPRRLQHAVGEDVAALEIGGELDLVDRHERHVEIARHRLDRGDPEARAGRLDLLLAGDERDLLGADALDALVVDLAREQAQRQPDHAARMRQHALDREMRLAGIGRPEHRGDAGAARTSRDDGPRKRNGHQKSKGSRNDQVMIRMVIVKGCDAPVAIANTPAGFNECRAGKKTIRTSRRTEVSRFATPARRKGPPNWRNP